MSGWDAGVVTSANLNLRTEDTDLAEKGLVGGTIRTYVDAQNQFAQFLRTHQTADLATFPYRDELKANYNENQYYVSNRMACNECVFVDPPLSCGACKHSR